MGNVQPSRSYETLRNTSATTAAPRTLRNMVLEEHLNDPSKKQRYVTAMFDIIAPKYDRFTRWFSFGMDAVWKKELLEHVKDKVRPGATCIDLASGTGDLSFAV